MITAIEMHQHAPRDLDELDRFTDFYVLEHEESNPTAPFRPGGEGAFGYYGTPHAFRLGGTSFEAYANALYEEAQRNRRGRSNYRVTLDGRHYRCQRGRSESGWQLALRRLPSTCPRLEDLVIQPKQLVEVLLGEWLLEGGLVLLAALTGNGKTTLAGGIARSLLEHYGGRMVTAEDPPELPLEGFWGGGTCNQFEVDWNETDPWRRGFAGSVRDALRRMPAARPAYLFVGEIRDSETATEVIKASLSGMLVIATIHAETTKGALERLTTLAEEGLGSASGALLGQALRIVIHQRLHLDPRKQGWERGYYELSALTCTGDTHPIAIALRDRKFAQLNEVVREQNTAIRLSSQNGHSGAELLTALHGRHR
jgi:Tfp pilus assembly pilus retraction ATPase PilT